MLNPTHLQNAASGTPPPARGTLEEPDHSICNWYFTRQDIEENSPSRKDGIDLRKETYLRKTYCTYLQEFGMKLKVPQVTIATAIVLCHRFYHRQSHLKNDRYTIATACMLTAGKVEEGPPAFKNIVFASYEIRNKKNPAIIPRIKQKEVYEQQRDLIVLAERVLLSTLGFDMNVHHPYKPLVEAIKKFKVAQNALAQVAWNFVNDGLRTSLCLQYKPHHIAAGAIFLAAKFLKVKLPSDGEVVWWQAFEVTPPQLEDISNQMLELYEQNGSSPSIRGSEPGGRSGVINQNLGISQAYAGTTLTNDCSQVTERSSPDSVKAVPGVGASHAINRDVSYDVNNSLKHVANTSYGKMNETSPHTYHAEAYIADENTCNNQSGGYAVRKHEIKDRDKGADITDHSQQVLNPVSNSRYREKVDGRENLQKLFKNKHSDVNALGTSQGYERNEQMGSRRAVESREYSDNSGDETGVKLGSPDIEGKRYWVTLDDVNKDKVKAALEKRRKSRGEGTDPRPTKPEVDLIDEDDLIRELESGVEAAAQAEKAKQERKESWARSLYRAEQEGVETRKKQKDEGENIAKRKRLNLESFPEKRRLKSSDWAPVKGDQQRLPADISYHPAEESKLPCSNLNEQVHSLRLDDKWSGYPMPNQLEKGGSPAKWRDYGGHDQLRHGDAYYENQHRHSNYYPPPPHSSQ